MKRARRYFFLSVATCGLALATASAEMKQPMIGEQAPPFSLPTLDGKTLALADLRGQFVVLHFGAGW